CDGWVRQLKMRYSDPWIGGVGGRVQQIRDGVVQTPVLRKKIGVITWYGKVIGDLDGTITDETRAVSLLPGGNMSFRREALNKVRFDMKLNEGAAVNFEADLCLQIKKMGYAILFDRQIEIAHYNAPRQITERRDDVVVYSNQYSHNYVYLAL